MFAFLPSRFWLFTSATLLAAGLVANPGLSRERLSALGGLGDRPAASSPGVEEPKLTTGRVVAEGCVVAYPGAEVVVGSEAAGRLVMLDVREGASVHKGDLLAVLNADDLEAELSEAEAKEAEARADTRFYECELRREEALIVRRASAPQSLDAIRRGLDTARARYAAAQAHGARCKALIAKTRINAPIDGVVTARHADPGEMVGVGDPILAIVDLNRLRVEAEVDEFDAGSISRGAASTITAEGHAGMSWQATVEEVPDVVVGRRLRPQDPGRPIDARVLAVKIAFSGATPLKLGQKVEIEFPMNGKGSNSERRALRGQ
jgi:HlyD family secretion protein